MHELETERLLLRRWRPGDRTPFAVLNADPEVMRHFPAPLTRRESDTFADLIEALMEADGWGLWALEVRATDVLYRLTADGWRASCVAD